MRRDNKTAMAELKVCMYEAQFGPSTSADALECAIVDDTGFRENGPFNPSASYFARNSRQWLEYACALEQLGK